MTASFPNFLKRVSVLVLAVAITILSSGVLYAAENGEIGGKPANPREDNPRSQSIFVHEAKPGDKIEDALTVINNSDEERVISVYSVDSQVSSDGAFACAQKAEIVASVGSWVKVSSDEVTVPPNETANVPFTITIPETAPPGEHNGCIVIQDLNKAPEAQGNGVTLSFRSAIRVAITIEGEITKGLSFVSPVTVSVGKDKITFIALLKNNGNVSLDTDIKVQAKNVLGVSVAESGGVFPVLAQNEGRFNFESNPFFWGGFYQVTGSASFNSDPASSLGESDSTETIQAPSKWIFVKPQPMALLIEVGVVALAIGAAAYFIFRRRQHKHHTKAAKKYTVKSGDSLQTIAKVHHVSWQAIARLNGLKKPYHLEQGEEIKIPPSKNS